MAAKRGKQFPYTYSYKTVPNSSGLETHHAVIAHHSQDGEVGHLQWHPEGEIQDVHVDETHRRKGVATGMLRYAEGLGVAKPKHSELRSEEGDAWARAVGGHIPELEALY